MPYIAKTTPFAASEGNTVTVTEKPMYDGGAAQRGDEVFVWFSETEGGNGLAWQGHIAGVARDGSGSITLTVVVTNKAPSNSLGKAALMPVRDVRDGSPQSGLASKLYFQAHDKVAALSVEEADYLRQFFRS